MNASTCNFTAGAVIGFCLLTGPASADGGKARVDYVLHCSGCHGADGAGLPSYGIPAVADQVGYFLRIPEGRAFIMQVPGLLNSGLSDERAAQVTNYMVLSFAGQSLPPDFRPYTAEEARKYREMRPSDIAATRKRLARQLAESGFPLR